MLHNPGSPKYELIMLVSILIPNQREKNNQKKLWKVSEQVGSTADNE